VSLTHAQILQTVERSPACVAAQDKAGWLALFSSEGSVEDPVGSVVNRRGGHPHPHTREDDLGRFWDTFIAGNEIRFEVKADCSGGNELARNVVIHTRLSTGMAIEVPAYLIYEIVEESGELRVQRLRACWDLRLRSRRALAAGARGLWTLSVLGAHMMRVQRMAWVLEYSRALTRGMFGRGGQLVSSLAKALNARDAQSLGALFAADAVVELPVGEAPAPCTSLEAGGELASLRLTAPVCAGWLTGFAYERMRPGGERESGIGFVEFDPASRKIVRARFFAG
jgi:ketosteroid isomerase-like protein